MGADESRRLQKTTGFVARGAATPKVRMGVLEGHPSAGHVDLKPLLVGDDMLMVEIFEKAGVRVPEHTHDDHESVVYLIRGRMRLVIGGDEFIVEAGDAWIHPRGVPHWSETLEDCLAVEIKSPPRKTWSEA
ncbi:MAG: cupin domain-containing protein [Burkholderiales bacterium]|nr:MAG: cupin domain-containing protein [Burkholderiales bacterium]